jgi:hypothetical protein
MEPDQVFNLCEGVLWIVMALILSLRIKRQQEYRDLLIISSSAFFIFGISDFIEIATRAWYTPFWLLITKGVCIVTFALALRTYLRRRKLNENKKT